MAEIALEYSAYYPDRVAEVIHKERTPNWKYGDASNVIDVTRPGTPRSIQAHPGHPHPAAS
jgi:hypothetical protein